MNAIKFIQQHGVDKARELLNADSDFKTYCLIDNSFWSETEGTCDSCVDLDQVKRLVESINMVKEYGGITMAKRQCACFTNACTSVGVKPSPRLLALQQAIADYEAIGGEHV